MKTQLSHLDLDLRRIVRLVAILNLAYFGVEFAVALSIGSVSLFADSIDFLEDASVNLLIMVALGWTAGRRAKLGMVLACVLLRAGHGLDRLGELSIPVPPEAVPLSLTGAGALVVNFVCASMLAKYRAHGGSLTRDGLPVGPQRRYRQHCDHRGRAGHGLSLAIGMARSDCWARDCGNERRRGEGGLAGRARGAGRGQSQSLISSISRSAACRC